ncbi:MAG: ZIP family metal transporter [Nitrososphaerales archaeon]
MPFRLINFAQVLILGAIAGFTIFLGLPLATLQSASPRKKGFLNAVAMGILVFLIIDVFGHAWDTASNAAFTAYTTRTTVTGATLDLVALFGGIAIGLLGLTFYEKRYMRTRYQVQDRSIAEVSASVTAPVVVATTSSTTGADLAKQQQAVSIVAEREATAYKLSMMIAIGIGAHNFSEGLAIGQSFSSGAIGLALILIIGFGSHNATEGFGIAGPLTGLATRPSSRFLATVGLVGGGPTFLGTLTGSLIGVSDFTYILFLSIAGGALVYVTLLMYNSGRRQTTNDVLMVGIFVGLCAGFVTDLIVTLGGA